MDARSPSPTAAVPQWSPSRSGVNTPGGNPERPARAPAAAAVPRAAGRRFSPAPARPSAAPVNANLRGPGPAAEGPSREESDLGESPEQSDGRQSPALSEWSTQPRGVDCLMFYPEFTELLPTPSLDGLSRPASRASEDIRQEVHRDLQERGPELRAEYELSQADYERGTAFLVEVDRVRKELVRAYNRYAEEENRPRPLQVWAKALLDTLDAVSYTHLTLPTTPYV